MASNAAAPVAALLPPDGILELLMPVAGMTCTSCVRRVSAALESLPGVDSVRVDLQSGLVMVAADVNRVAPESLRDAVRSTGYQPGEVVSALPSSTGSSESRALSSKGRLALPVGLGILASLLLAAFYLGVVTMAQGFDHAAELMLQDWYFVLPIVLGFGTQVGLFTYLRRATHRHAGRSATAAAGVGTGTSSVSMVACCAHHLADLLPIIGLSGAAIFLNDYRQPLMVLGIATNLAGIAILFRAIRRARRMESAV